MRIGVDLGGTKTESVLLDAAGREVERRRTATPTDRGAEAVVAGVVEHVRALETVADTPCTVGVGTPGALDPRTGRIKNSNTTSLNGRPLQAELEDALERDVRLANDADCFAVAEVRAGAARGADLAFGIILGTGVGGGLVIAGEPRRGPHRIAGEWGHSPLQEGRERAEDPPGEPPRCYCGNTACVETRLSGPGLLADWRRRCASAGVEPPVVDRADRVFDMAGEDTDAGAAVRAAARAATDAWMDAFGEGIARLIHILDPDVIVLGGGMSNHPLVYDAGVARVAAHLFNDVLETPIRRHALGDAAGALGAAWLWPEPAGTLETPPPVPPSAEDPP